MKRPSLLIALSCLLALLLAGAAGAEPPAEPEGWAYDLSNELMSPFCPGVTVAECSSSQAKSLIMWMVVQEAAGRTQADVEEELYERYGEQIRPAPKWEGIGLSAYLVPAGVFLGGGVFIAWFLSRQTRRAPGPEEPPAPAAVDPELERIVEEELRP
jgi:cytochrome c-type biogenesis protein CcmH